MVVSPDNRIEKRPVTIGIQMPDYVEITSGVTNGEQVVVSDRSALKSGQTVQSKTLQAVAYGASGSR